MCGGGGGRGFFRRGRAFGGFGFFGGEVLAFLVGNHRRIFAFGRFALDDERPQNGVAKPKRFLEFAQSVVFAFDVEKNIMRFEQFAHRIRKPARAPVFEAMHLPAAVAHSFLVTIAHRADPFALVGMDDDHDFVVSHFPFGLRSGRSGKAGIPA